MGELKFCKHDNRIADDYYCNECSLENAEDLRIAYDRLTTECDRLKENSGRLYEELCKHASEITKWKSIADKLAEFIKEDYQVEDWSDQNCTCKICELIKSYNAVKGE